MQETLFPRGLRLLEHVMYIHTYIDVYMYIDILYICRYVHVCIYIYTTLHCLCARTIVRDDVHVHVCVCVYA